MFGVVAENWYVHRAGALGSSRLVCAALRIAWRRLWPSTLRSRTATVRHFSGTKSTVWRTRRHPMIDKVQLTGMASSTVSLTVDKHA